MYILSLKFSGIICLLSIIFYSCTGNKANQLTDQERKDGWSLLFDGKTTDGWHLYNAGKVVSKWMVKNGELYSDTSDQYLQGDLVTDKEFRNFDLSFEWKIQEGGNSGVFIDVQERADLRATWVSGPEYQLLEKNHPDNAISTKKSGAMFGLDSPMNSGEANPANLWNKSEIKQINGKIEYYLNGVLTVQEDLNSQAWLAKVAKSNFKNFQDFGKHLSGHIALQYWSKSVAIRNMKIKEL
jgi:hypothetical protein